MSTYPVKKGETLPLTIETLAFGGKGVARKDGYTVFVEHGLPGQTVDATIVRRKRSHAEARIERVITASPGEVEPRCAHFGVCGGCSFQHYDYQAQLEAKREQVAGCLSRLGNLPDVEVLPTIASPDQFAYRNKMEYTFSTRWLTREEVDSGQDSDQRFGLGLHVRRRYDRVVNVGRCHLQSEDASRILAIVRDFAEASGHPPYSTRTHTGFWRFLVIREGIQTGDRMVNVITSRVEPGSLKWNLMDDLGRALTSQGPRITSLLHGMTSSRASVAFCEDARVLAGEPIIRERIQDLDFEIGPNTFFQTNTRGADALFTEALRMGEFTEGDSVWDLYCGAGAISLPLARKVKSVLGIELVPEAVEAARRNAAANGIGNAEFLAGDAKDLLEEVGSSPRVVVVDPPRDGLHKSVVDSILSAGPPERIVYISCNPATLARDLRLFVDGGYDPGPVRPVDMFPHTPHVECVTALNRGTDS